MNATSIQLLKLLADGAQHSGGALAASLGVTRSAVWKCVGELRGLGVDVASLDRRGYYLTAPVELLDAARMRTEAQAAGRFLPDALEVHPVVDSTNDYLQASAPPPVGGPRVVFAELQHAGRGRRGRHWIAPFGTGLTFSIGWTFAETPPDLAALGLAMGVAAVTALHGVGASGLMLKWPNDILIGGAKLGGLLIQLRHEAGGPATVVVGLGVNLRLPQATKRRIADAGVAGALPPTDLASAIAGSLPSRNAIAARLILAMTDALATFGRAGFAGFAGEWRRLDALRDAPIRVLQGTDELAGTARGADRDGALLVERGGRLERVFSGDVSIRPDHAP